ncbi:zinc finger protein 43-like [Toxorhynchites rutilus septentrionalis]|uniref:zinc finger protein 43-like n=1 Tax=Toxorhynchites rutilus septentrionalis TaxID=329112 RepID=UPI00247B0357|nr:zinc finger protein 43-like [Toxorhynchites rutilus septentrionalis]
MRFSKKMSSGLVMPGCCRCCLEEENDMVYVFDILDEFDSKICNLIADCGGILITENDSYSKNICGNCLNDLANAARFRERCLKTESVLQNTIDSKEAAVICVALNSQSSDTIYEEIETIDDGEQLDLGVDQIIQFSDRESAHSESDARVKYIIEEDPVELELQDFDYTSSVKTNDIDAETDSIHQEYIDDKYMSDDNELTEKETKWIMQSKTVQFSFICQQCGAGFALQKNLAKHLATHQNFVCDICLTVFDSDENLQSHKSTHEKSANSTDWRAEHVADEPVIFKGSSVGKLTKNHHCSYCDKSFVSNSALTSHIRVHTQERPFPCSFCTKRFRTVGGKELHERRHNGLKPYKCDFCGRGFAESSNLKVHRRTHTNEKPHVCTICNRAFSRVFLLKIHQRTHTGERPFPCSDCGKQFSQQGDLAAHRRIHTGERPHRCDICGKGFIKSSGLTQHRRKHGGQTKIVRAVKNIDNAGGLIQELKDYDFDIIHEGDSTQENDKDLIETIVVRRKTMLE